MPSVRLELVVVVAQLLLLLLLLLISSQLPPLLSPRLLLSLAEAELSMAKMDEATFCVSAWFGGCFLRCTASIAMLKRLPKSVHLCSALT